MLNKPFIFSRVRLFLARVVRVLPYFGGSYVKAFFVYVWFVYDTFSSIEGLMILWGLMIIIFLLPTPGRDDTTDRERIVVWVVVLAMLGLVYRLTYVDLDQITRYMSV